MSYTDLSLPGNAGQSLRFGRIYSGGTWYVGLLGHVVHVDPITSDPGFGTQLMMDGSPHVADWLSLLNPPQCLPPNVNSPSCQVLADQ